MAELTKDIAEFTEDKQMTIKRNEVQGRTLSAVLRLLVSLVLSGARKARKVKADRTGGSERAQQNTFDDIRCPCDRRRSR